LLIASFADYYNVVIKIAAKYNCLFHNSLREISYYNLLGISCNCSTNINIKYYNSAYDILVVKIVVDNKHFDRIKKFLIYIHHSPFSSIVVSPVLEWNFLSDFAQRSESIGVF